MNLFFWIWLGVSVLSLIIEFITFDLVSIWFFPAGIIALILNACNVQLSIQIIVFFVISIALILSLRKITLKYLNKNDNTKTNAEGEIGKKFKLLTDITEDSFGTIKINGVIWNVTTEDNAIIKKDSMVEIIKLNGNKYIVKKA